MKRIRRVGRSATVVIAALALVSLAACSGSSSKSKSSTTASGTGASATSGSSASSAPAGAASTITVWADPTKVAAISAVIGPFEKANNVKVNVVQKPADTFTTNFIQQAPTGKGPDVIEDAVNTIGQYADNGVIAPITIGNESDFAKVAITAVTYKNQTWGMPSFIENVELYRNTALVPKAATTMAQVIANGEKLKKAGKVKFAVAIPPDPYHLYGLMGSYGIGAYALKSDGTYNTAKINLAGQGGEAWAKQLAAWGKSGIVNTNLTFAIGESAFEKGQTPYFMTGPWALADFKAAHTKVKFAIDPIPSAGGHQATPFVGGQAFLVSKYSKNSLVANKFVADYLGTQPVQVSIANAGQRAPALTAAFNQVTKTNPIIATFGKLATQQGVPFPNTVPFNALFNGMGTLTTAILQGKVANPGAKWTALAAKYQATAK